MRIHRYLILFFMLITTLDLMGQGGCFSRFYHKGKEMYEAGEYEDARHQFRAALECDDRPRENDAKEWIDKCDHGEADRLQAQREETERRAREAELARRQADTLADSLYRLTAGRNQEREAFYSELSRDLPVYIDKLKDLRDQLPDIGNAFLEPRFADRFKTLAGEYNQARAVLYQSRQEKLEKARLLYPEHPGLSTGLEQVYVLALDRIHEQIVLPLNKTVNAMIEDAALGHMSRLAAQKKAKKNARQALKQLASPLQELEEKVRTLLSVTWPEDGPADKD